MKPLCILNMQVHITCTVVGCKDSEASTLCWEGCAAILLSRPSESWDYRSKSERTLLKKMNVKDQIKQENVYLECGVDGNALYI